MSIPKRQLWSIFRQNDSSISSKLPWRPALSGLQGPTTPQPWICRRCMHQLKPKSLEEGRRTAAHVTNGVNKTPLILLIRYQARYASTETQKPPDEATTTPPPSIDSELPSASEHRRSPLSKRFSSLMDRMQTNIFFAGQRLNDLTGYSGIEALRRDIEVSEATLKSAQESLQSARAAYTAAIAQRSASQREVNELLQRKHAWSPTDLERFTELYRSDHANEQAEGEAQAALARAEKEAEEASSRLSQKILARYHEEQIWSDKIRRMSTWGTWGLMGVNVLLFLVFQIGVEPWRRKRLVKGFEEKVITALESQGEHANRVTGEALAALQASHMAVGGGPSMTERAGQLVEAEQAIENVVVEQLAAERSLKPAVLREETGSPALSEVSWLQKWLHIPLPSFAQIKSRVQESFGDDAVTVRHVDLTKKALEGAFIGVMLTSIIATLIRGR